MSFPVSTISRSEFSPALGGKARPRQSGSGDPHAHKAILECAVAPRTLIPQADQQRPEHPKASSTYREIAFSHPAPKLNLFQRKQMISPTLTSIAVFVWF